MYTSLDIRQNSKIMPNNQITVNIEINAFSEVSEREPWEQDDFAWRTERLREKERETDRHTHTELWTKIM